MKQKVKKNKIDGSDLVTRSILRQELSKFATKKDLKRFATKDELVDFKIDVLAEINRTELKAKDREQNYHSEVMTQFDKVMKKLETMTQENTLSESHQDQKLEDHEVRIKVLESSAKS